MGGQNHQPTRNIRLIAPSAWLSQKVGEGFAAVLQANNELENAIMVAMDHLHVEELAEHLDDTPASYLDKAISQLDTTIRKISDIQNGYQHLLNAAERENYKGNPLASTITELDLSVQFGGKLVVPAVNAHAWNSVETRIAKSNILSTLAWESSEFERVRELTGELRSVIERAAAILRTKGNRAFVEAVEWNRIPLRQVYARVFSEWNYLHAMFLYSALMMTELFYRSNGLPSLLQEQSAVTTQHVA